MASPYECASGPTPPVAPLVGVTGAPPVIPKLYWDAYSDEQRIKTLWQCFDRFTDLFNELVPEVNENSHDNEEILETLEQIKNGEWADGYVDSLAKWVDANLQQLVARLAQYVFPGFFWDGKCWRYQLVVPEGWEFLKFKWVWVPEDMSYHITLNFVDQTVQTDQETYECLQRQIDELRHEIESKE